MYEVAFLQYSSRNGTCCLTASRHRRTFGYSVNLHLHERRQNKDCRPTCKHIEISKFGKPARHEQPEKFARERLLS